MKKKDEIQQFGSQSKFELFLETLRIGSITKAAEQLNYTQPGLTYLLNSLETDLGITLMERTFRGVSLTADGEQLLPYIEDLVEGEKRLRDKVGELTQNNSERVRVAAIQSIAKYCLPRLIMRFRELYPGANIDISVANGAQLPQLLAERKADIGIGDIGHADGLETIPLTEDELYVFLPAAWDIEEHDGTVSLNELTDLPMLYFSSNPQNAGVVAMKDRELQSRVMVASDGDTILSMVEAGVGFAMLPKRYMQSKSKHIRVCAADPPVRRTVGIMAPSLRRMSRQTKRFAEMIQEYGIDEENE